MENYIPVITRSGHPLSPCHPRRAHSLVKQGKASYRHCRCIRCILLNRTNVPKVKNRAKLHLRINPGSSNTAIAATRENPGGSRSVLLLIDIRHQGKAIKRRMVKRSRNRRNRRYRLRYRAPRFNNRTRQPDWLPPSVLSRLQNTLTWVRRITKLLPVTTVHVEDQVSDPQAIRNPEIRGKQYQQGPVYRTNLRAAALLRHDNQCVYCGRSGKRTRLELDHVTPKADGGTDRFDNLVASCVPCNRDKDNRPLEDFLRRRPAKLAEIRAKLGQDLGWAAQVNIILPKLLEELRRNGWVPARHSAATTAAGRINCHIEKSQHNDAAVIGCPARLDHLPTNSITITATGRGNRQRIMPNRYGTPRGRDFREYSKLPRHIQKTTPTPAHKKRQKRVGGVATGDYIAFSHREKGPVHGYGTISHQQVAITKPVWQSTKAELARVVERHHGYQVTYPPRN